MTTIDNPVTRQMRLLADAGALFERCEAEVNFNRDKAEKLFFERITPEMKKAIFMKSAEMMIDAELQANPRRYGVPRTESRKDN
jgi:hypothetical protein